MGNKMGNLLENDRIVEINGIQISVRNDYNSSRRNIICHSNKLEEIIKENNLFINKGHHINEQILIQKLLKNLDDIIIIKVKGFY